MSTNTNCPPDDSANGWPAWRSLFHGAMRQSLAAVYSVARIGTQGTNAWERPIRYVADDNQGNVGVVEFWVDGAVGAVVAHTPKGRFDRARAIDLAPPTVRDALIRVCDLPLLQSLLQEGPGVPTGVWAAFWTVGEFIQSSESWGDTCLSEVFETELLADSAWETEGTRYFGLAPGVANLIIAIARRAVVRAPMVTLSDRELRELVPKASKHEDEALNLLTSEGLFEIAPGAAG
jgi:hypothetical protein